MKISDCEFLYWVAKRLLYKHRDDPKISSKLEQIANELYHHVRNIETMCKQDYSEVDTLIS